jgi:2-polyprenyl-3-methyl-5-hydroxy-6-metoxy-1,4-benzoquinol methylase
MSNVENFYNANSQSEWDRLGLRHRSEFDNSIRAILEYLPPAPADLIDIGGGPGRYSIALTLKGYTVTLVDLAEANLDLAWSKAAEAGVALAAILHANALDLTGFSEGSFAAALLMGPLYHLHQEVDRVAALAQARRLIRPGGLIFVSFITRFSAFRDAAVHGYTFVEADPVYAESWLTTGINYHGGGFTDAYFAHPDEVIPLCEGAGFKTIKMIGCEGILSGHEQYVYSLTGEARQFWLDLNYRFAQEPTLYGASDHLLYIGRKE